MNKITDSTHKMTLNSLEAFDAVMKTGSATGAAKSLGLTQPGVSRLIAQLENNVGFALFYREKARLFPTDEAIALHKQVEISLASVYRVEQLAKNIHESHVGELNIVAPSSFVAGPLAEAVASFVKRHPNVKISLDSHSPARARELVANKAFDCGFIQFPENHEGLWCEPIITSDLVCAVSSEHAFAARQQLTPKDLKDESLVLLGSGRHSRKQIEHAFLQHNVRLKVRVETHTVTTACTLAKHNVGIAIVNELLAQQFKDNSLTLMPFVPKIELTYGFITSASTQMNRLTHAFYSHCKEYFDEFEPVR
ncbi:LysR family transcriptional regulator [Pseudoalteromonas sp. GB56]